MNQATKSKLLLGTAIVCGSISVLFIILSFILIKDGAFPPEGTGSLGHVGMVIGGIIGGLLAIVFAAAATYCFLKAKSVLHSKN